MESTQWRSYFLGLNVLRLQKTDYRPGALQYSLIATFVMQGILDGLQSVVDGEIYFKYSGIVTSPFHHGQDDDLDLRNSEQHSGLRSEYW